MKRARSECGALWKPIRKQALLVCLEILWSPVMCIMSRSSNHVAYFHGERNYPTNLLIFKGSTSGTQADDWEIKTGKPLQRLLWVIVVVDVAIFFLVHISLRERRKRITNPTITYTTRVICWRNESAAHWKRFEIQEKKKEKSLRGHLKFTVEMTFVLNKNLPRATKVAKRQLEFWRQEMNSLIVCSSFLTTSTGIAYGH